MVRDRLSANPDPVFIADWISGLSEWFSISASPCPAVSRRTVPSLETTVIRLSFCPKTGSIFSIWLSKSLE